MSWLKLLREAWALAVEALCWVEQKGLSERVALLRASRELDIQDPRAMGLAHKLFLETVRRQNFLDHLINSVSKENFLYNLDPGVRAFLRLYTYETKVRGHDSYEEATNIARTGRSILGWRRIGDVEETLAMLLSLIHI